MARVGACQTLCRRGRGRAVKDFVRGYEEAGCDELVLFPTVADIDDLERLQEAIA